MPANNDLSLAQSLIEEMEAIRSKDVKDRRQRLVSVARIISRAGGMTETEVNKLGPYFVNTVVNYFGGIKKNKRFTTRERSVLGKAVKTMMEWKAPATSSAPSL